MLLHTDNTVFFYPFDQTTALFSIYIKNECFVISPAFFNVGLEGNYGQIISHIME